MSEQSLWHSEKDTLLPVIKTPPHSPKALRLCSGPSCRVPWKDLGSGLRPGGTLLSGSLGVSKGREGPSEIELDG